jgi:hypothetical protein
MNRMRIACPVLLCLLFAAVAYARPQQDEPKSHVASAPSQQKPEAKPEGPERQQNAKPEKSEKEATPEKRSDSEHQSGRQANPASRSETPAGSGQEQNRASRHARPAGKSAHIPDAKFRATFGRQRPFKVSRPVVVNNQQTIQYGGYNFVLVDAWPAEWAYTDDVYIDYIDGEYFLFDLLHPGIRIAVFVEE